MKRREDLHGQGTKTRGHPEERSDVGISVDRCLTTEIATPFRGLDVWTPSCYEVSLEFRPGKPSESIHEIIIQLTGFRRLPPVTLFTKLWICLRQLRGFFDPGQKWIDVARHNTRDFTQTP